LHIQTGIGIGCYHLIPTSNYIDSQTAALALKAISISTEHWHSSTNAIPPPEYRHPNEALGTVPLTMDSDGIIEHRCVPDEYLPAV